MRIETRIGVVKVSQLLERDMGNSIMDLTERQQRERDEYNERIRQSHLTEVDFEHFNHPRFGPWNPYWFIYDYVRTNFSPEKHELLSYGCGQGANALRLAHLGFRVSGFDISDGNVGVANMLAEKYGYADRTAFTVQAAEALEYPSDSFDVVAGDNVLHHVDLEKAIPELHRVLKPGGVALFKDSLQTPFRDRIRSNPPVTWILPVGVKNRVRGTHYRDTDDERPLNDGDFEIFRRHFPNTEAVKFRVLAVFGGVINNRPLLERCDYYMFKVLPFLRRFGDNVVVILKKNLEN